MIYAQACEDHSAASGGWNEAMVAVTESCEASEDIGVTRRSCRRSKGNRFGF